MKVINFNEFEYQRALKDLTTIVDIINKYSKELTDKGYTINNEFLNDISKLGYKAKNIVYLKELECIADLFGVDFNEIKTFEYKMKNPLFSDIANNKCKLIYSFIDEISVKLYRKPYLVNYIDILDNIATIDINADKELKHYYTDYTENKDEDKILEYLNKLIDIYKHLKDMGIDKREIPINDYNLQIDTDSFHRLCK